MHGSLPASDAALLLPALNAAEINAEASAVVGIYHQYIARATAVGEKLLATKRALRDAIGHGHFEQWLEQHLTAIKPRTARDWMLLARLPEQKRRCVAEMTLGDALRCLRGNEKSVEHYTPVEIIEAARRVFGGTIDLDPASCAEANAVVRATKFYSKQDDGLSKSWRGHVWSNFPYDGTSLWTEKLAREFEAGRISAAISLINWFTFAGSHPLVSDCCLGCLPKKRIQFWGPGARDKHNPKASVLVYLGDEPDKFAHEFQIFGPVWGPWQRGAA
jgi:hypothetical protein